MSTSPPRRLQRQTLLIFLALPIILLSVGFSYQSLREFREQDAESTRIRRFLYPWTSLSLDIRRAESSQRGYLLTGRDEYLKPYEELRPKIDQELHEIDKLSSPDNAEQKLLEDVRGLARQKLSELQRTLDLYRAGHKNEALAVINSDRGDDYMTRISDMMSQVRDHERFLLGIHSRVAGDQARNTFLLSTAGDLILLCFLVIAGGVIDRDDKRRTLDQESIRQLNLRLSAELKSRSDILGSIQDGFCAFDRTCCATYVNPAVEHMLNLPGAQLIGKSCQEIMDTAHSPGVQEQIDQVGKQRISARSDQFLPRYQRWLRLRFYPSSDGGFTLYFNDITDEKQADAERTRLLDEIEQARALLDTFFENAPVGLAFWDTDRRFLRVNQTLARINGLPAAEHKGKLASEVMPRVEPDVSALFERILNGESITGLEVSSLEPQRSGKVRTWVVSYYPIGIRGEIVGIGGIIEEITERKTIEESLRQSAKLESLGVLAGGIAHDFNNLLTGILGNASLAIDSLSPNSPARPVLDDVVAASERAAHLTHQMLAYAGKSHFLLQPVDVSDLVREISSLVRISVPRQVQLRFELPPHIPCVLGDTSQLQQVVMNLVINGAEAIPEGQQGTVLITTGSHDIDENYIRQALSSDEITPGPYVYLEVHDTGIGMDQATIARIFDPFFTTKFTGRGLGLAAVMGIVRGHKGTLKVYSTPGKGTTFKVLLPATAESRRNTHENLTDSNLDGLGTILVVDDEEVVRKTTKITLEKYGYQVLLAENGRDAVEIVRSRPQKISLVLLDLTMPLMSGEEALREIRAIDPEMRVILSSGFNEMEAIDRFSGKNLAGFLQKPYTSRRLAEAVQKAIAALPENAPIV